MKIMCAWCHKDMGEKDGDGVEGISHSICNQCFDKLQAEAGSRTATPKKASVAYSLTKALFSRTLVLDVLPIGESTQAG